MVTWKTCEKCLGSGKIDGADCLEQEYLNGLCQSFHLPED